MEAITIAESTAKLPTEWHDFAQSVFEMRAKTYVAALGTALLAKATDSNIDTLAIKNVGDRGYSLRTLGHTVLVPAARQFKFSLRATGREPLNNQPFFRYSHMSEIERVRDRAEFESFLDGMRRADKLSSPEALNALAAFLRIAFLEASKLHSIGLEPGELAVVGLLRAISRYTAVSVSERPKRIQAWAAACLELNHRDVRSRKINDPSRDVPGDVQAFHDDVPYLSVEVRGKPVPATELEAFIESCVNIGITRVMLYVDWPSHERIELERLNSEPYRQGAVMLTVFERATEMGFEALTWADMPLVTSTALLADRFLYRLREVEVSRDALQQWVNLVADSRASES